MKMISHSQRGVTLIEILVSIGILASITAGIVALSNQQSEDTRAAVTSLHIKTVGEAANEYIKDNYAAITGSATATQPVLIRVSDLIASGVLNTGFSVSNPRGQDTCVLVLQPSPNNLNAMVVTESGDTIDDLTLGQIAATIGAAGGGIYSTAATTFRGAMGGWSTSIGNFANTNHLGQKCNGVAGTISLTVGHPAMALWFADGNSVSATLYRDAVPGNPALNTMNTPILMGAGTVQTVGNACTSTGALGRGASGKVLSCQGGTWQQQGSSYWGDPVNQAVAMPACTAANANETRVRYGYATAPTRRLFTCDGSAWQPVGVDHSGNLSVPGSITMSNGSTISSPGRLHIEAAENLYLKPWAGAGQVIVGGGGGNGQLTTIGRLTTNEYVQVNGVATENAGCSPNGLVGRDTNGLLLSCQSGAWKGQSTSDVNSGLPGSYCQPNKYCGRPSGQVACFVSGSSGSTVQAALWNGSNYQLDGNPFAWVCNGGVIWAN